METSENSKIQITINGLNHLSEIRRWTMFISIFGLIFIGLCVILVPVLIIYTKNSGFLEAATALPLILVSIVYFFPIYFLLKFSTNSKKAVQDSDNNSMETSLKYLKLHYRFMGIFVIAFLCIYFVSAIVFVVTDFFKPDFI